MKPATESANQRSAKFSVQTKTGTLPSPGAPTSDAFPVRYTWQIDDQDYNQLREVVLQLLRIDLANYRTQQMERRLCTLLERRQAPNWSSYLARLQQNQEEQAYLRDYLTINVSSFYRDATRWDYLRKHVLPEVLATASGGKVEAWSAGCSMGAEAYTLAMLLHEKASQANHRIWATDIDQTVLKRARTGGPYGPHEIKELPEVYQKQYLQSEGTANYRVVPSLQRLVQFEHFDLLQDTTQRQFDLVACRNVSIYFPAPVKHALHTRLVQSLRPGGILFIGATETIADYQQMGLAQVAPCLYRRQPQNSPRYNLK